jgi:hypothetical protein
MHGADGASDTQADLAAHFASAFGLSPGQAAGVMASAMPEFAWRFEGHTLSRGGLADLVATLGKGKLPGDDDGAAAFAEAGARSEGEAILARFLGGGEQICALAHRVAALTGVDRVRVQAMLPSLAALAIAGLAARATGLAAILKVIPPLGRAAEGTPLADLAGILRRRCGVGPYAARRLRRLVRRELAAAGGFRCDGVASWYMRRMFARPLLSVLRRLTATPARYARTAADAKKR